MKTILFDFVRRWWWAYLTWIIATGLMWPAAIIESRNPMFFPMAIFVGPLLLSLDLARGTARASSILPLSRGQLGRAWWILAVVVPVLGALLVRLGTTVIVMFFQPSVSPAWWMAPAFVLELLLAGTFYWLLMYAPAGQPAGWKNQVIGTVWGMLWGLGVGGSMLIGQHFVRIWHGLDLASQLLIGLLGIAATVSSYHRAAALPARRLSTRSGSVEQSTSAKSYSEIRAPGLHRLTGFPLLMMMTFGQGLLMAIYTLAIFSVFNRVAQGQSLDAVFRGLTSTSEGGIPTYWLWLLLFAGFSGVRWTQSIRALRILPISVQRLNVCLLLLNVSAVLSVFLLPALAGWLFYGFSLELLSLHRLMLPIGVTAILGSLSLRSGPQAAFICLFAFVPASSIWSPWIHAQSSNPELGITAGLALVLIAALMNHFWLTKSGAVYKTRKAWFGLGAGDQRT